MLASLISLCLSTVWSVAVRGGILTLHLVCSAHPSIAAGGPLGSGFVDRGVLFSSQYAHFEYKPGVHLASSPLFLSPLPCYASIHISALTQDSTMALGKDLKIQASTQYYARPHTHTLDIILRFPEPLRTIAQSFIRCSPLLGLCLH